MPSGSSETPRGSVGLGNRGDRSLHLPEELVQVPMLHVLKHHDKGVSVATHAIELDNVLVLQVGEQLSLPLEVLPGSQGGILQGLETGRDVVLTNQKADGCPFSVHFCSPGEETWCHKEDTAGSQQIRFESGFKDHEATSQQPSLTLSYFDIFIPEEAETDLLTLTS